METESGSDIRRKRKKAGEVTRPILRMSGEVRI